MGKNSNDYNRFRNITVLFRMTKSESDELNMRIKLSGLTKQKYLIDRSLCRDIIVIGNPRVYKALRNKMEDILCELKRLGGGDEPNPEILTVIQAVSEILNGLKNNN